MIASYSIVGQIGSIVRFSGESLDDSSSTVSVSAGMLVQLSHYLGFGRMASTFGFFE